MNLFKCILLNCLSFVTYVSECVLLLVANRLEFQPGKQNVLSSNTIYSIQTAVRVYIYRGETGMIANEKSFKPFEQKTLLVFLSQSDWNDSLHLLCCVGREI